MTEQESAGATPVEDGATPSQSTPVGPPAAEPAPGADAALGDAGKRALDAMKAERKAAEDRARKAEAELETLRTSGLSEHEKAIAQAKKDATSEAEKAWSARLRTSEVRRALQAAGVTADALDLAAGAAEFSDLVVDDDGVVADLERTVDAFRRSHPSLFAAARPAAGNFDGGSGGASAAQSWTRDQIGQMSQAEFEKNEAEIMRAMREGRIRDQ
jgi:hypothetical protein